MEQAGGGDIKNVFNAYTGNKEMDGKTFAKLSKDCGLLDKKLTTTDVDLIFAKIKTSSSVRTISFEQFVNGVKQMAEKKQINYDDIAAKICQSGGPQFQGTQGASKFHDDKSTFTGKFGKKTLINIIYFIQGIHKGKDSKPEPDNEEEKATQVNKPKEEAIKVGAPADSLQIVFDNFSQKAAEIDGKTFAKFSKDCQILDKKLTSTDIDLIFAKIKVKDARKINFTQFENGLKLCAEKKGCSYDDLVKIVLEHGGPVYQGTKTDKVKFHDDKSLYTGVYAQGGPTNVDKDKIEDISKLCDRTQADVRGVKK